MHKEINLNTIQERSKYLHEKYINDSKNNNAMIRNLYNEYLKHDKSDLELKLLFEI
jgi:hypothetical protein